MVGVPKQGGITKTLAFKKAIKETRKKHWRKEQEKKIVLPTLRIAPGSKRRFEAMGIMGLKPAGGSSGDPALNDASTSF